MVYLLIFLALFLSLFLMSRVLTRSISRLLMRIVGSRNLAISFFHLLLLPGVVVHELAHLITAEVLFVRTGALNFKPQLEEDSVVMGTVGIEKTDPLRRAVIGFAPVFVGIILISISVLYFLSEQSPLSQTLSYILVFFIVFEIGNTMFSSKKDLEGTIGLLIIIVSLLAVFYFLGFRIPDSFINFLNSENFVGIAQRGIRILLFPIGIDVIIILIARFLNNKY